MKNNHEQSEKLLVSFLRVLADNIENNKIGPEQILQVGEFFMSFLFNHTLSFERENKEDKISLENDMMTNQDSEEDTFTDKDFLKFLTMGWYVYCQILEGKTL